VPQLTKQHWTPPELRRFKTPEEFAASYASKATGVELAKLAPSHWALLGASGSVWRAKPRHDQATTRSRQGRLLRLYAAFFSVPGLSSKAAPTRFLPLAFA
jgi:hypothetical protein